MEHYNQAELDNVLTAASSNAASIAVLTEQLQSRRSLQKSFGMNLLLRTDIPLAEVARVVGVNRMTLHRWFREMSSKTRRENDSAIPLKSQ